MEEHDTDIGIDEGRSHSNDLVVCLEGGIILVFIIEDVGVSHVKFVGLIYAEHVLVPNYSFFQLINLGLHYPAIAQGKSIEDVPLNSS
jgi:hypothetical protein